MARGDGGGRGLEPRRRDQARRRARWSVIDNQINQATATMRLKALLPNPERALWPNQFVKARLLARRRARARW